MTDQIDHTSIAPGETNPQSDDDQHWIDAVLTGLATRSLATREALAKALLNGQDGVTSGGHVSGLKLNSRKSAKNEHSTCDQSADPFALHVSGLEKSAVENTTKSLTSLPHSPT